MGKLVIGFACFCLLSASASKGATMRSVNFRDNVLWAIAEKDGIDPTTDLLNDQSREYVSSINAWLRRLYDVADFAEWTDIQAFTPDPTTHLILWDAVPSVLSSEDQLDPPKIGKVLKVYLIDPRTTWTPVDTPFRETKQGIYVGFEHGPTVWMKFIPRAPVFTSEVWDPSRTYRKDEITYSPAAGECYKSKSNGNRAHDPSDAVNQPLQTEIVVERVPDNPGLIQVNKNVRINISLVSPTPNPLNPPVLNDQFYVELFDVDDTPLGDFLEVADGVKTLSTILTNLRTGLLAALPGTFTITINTSDSTMDISGPYDFSLGHTGYTRAIGTNSTFKTSVLQPYVPALAASFGTPQENQLTLSINQVVTGAVYTLTFTESDGSEHTVSYTALSSDSSPQILIGLINAITAAAATDTFLEGVDMSFNPSAPSVTFTTRNSASLDAQMRPIGSAYWTLIPFPFALVDQVVRGAYADVLKTEGQADKGMAEEQSVPQETQLRIGAGVATGSDMITDQETARGRYAR